MKFKKFAKSFVKTLSVSSLIFVLVFLSVFSAASYAVAQVIPSVYPVSRFFQATPESTVHATAFSPDGQTVYFGGDFPDIRDRENSSLVFDTGNAGLTVGEHPLVNGQVNISIPDGQGGWYIGGNFTEVDGQLRKNLAHIRQNLTLDQNFNAGLISGVSEPQVWSLALDSTTNTLYVGGIFSSIDGQARTALASINSVNGDLLNWSPNLTSSFYSPQVTALAFDSSDNTLFVGGYFLAINGQTREATASFDTTNGELTSWTPNISGGPYIYSMRVYGFALDSANDLIYIGGKFRNTNGAPSHLVRVNTSTGQEVPLSAQIILGAAADDSVNALVLDAPNNILYLGGGFVSVGGEVRNGIASINTSNGQVTTWNPIITGSLFNGRVNTLALDAVNDTIYVGGYFNSVNGWAINRLAAINTNSGALDPWRHSLAGGLNTSNDRPVHTLSLNPSNNEIYVGGDKIVRGVFRNRIAALDVTTGQPTSWGDGLLTGPDDSISAIEAATNGTVYIAGSFSSVGGQNRVNLASITSDGQVTSWNPIFPGVVKINDIELDEENNTLYVGGNIRVNHIRTVYLASINMTTSVVTPLSVTSTDRNPDVLSLALDSANDILYVGGDFISLGGQLRNILGAINTNTGLATSWDPGMPPNSIDPWPEVYAVELSNDGTLYVGGRFGHSSGRTNLMSFITSTGEVGGLNLYVVNTVYALANDPTNNVMYVGGQFTSVGGQSREGLAALNSVTGTLFPWNPILSIPVFTKFARAIEVSPVGSMISVGGRFTRVNNDDRYSFAVFSSDGNGPFCPADFNEDSEANIHDFLAFLSAWFAGNMSADADNNGTLDVNDIFAFLRVWFAGC